MPLPFLLRTMKNHYCFFENFNNYFNRKIKKYDSLEDYESRSSNYFIPLNKESAPVEFDFNPNDNVATEVIVNDIPFDPDYCLILDSELNIVSRWFVIEQVRNRHGQWVYSLKRDVVADNINRVLTSKFFCEKGTLMNDDPMIINDEGVRVNQIKKEEILLKDISEVGWIVGYMARTSSLGTVSSTSRTVPQAYVTLNEMADYIGGNISAAVLSDMITAAKPFSVTNPTIGVKYLHPGGGMVACTIVYNEVINNLSTIYGGQYRNSGSNNWAVACSSFEVAAQNDKFLIHINNNISGLLSAINASLQLTVPNEVYFNSTQLSRLLSYSGQVVRIGSDYYTMSFEISGEQERSAQIGKGNILYFDNAVSAAAQGEGVSEGSDWILYLAYGFKTVKLNLSAIPLNSYTTKISASHNNLIDAPYAMFAIPCGSIEIAVGTNPITPWDKFTKTIGKQEALDMASAIATALGTNLYDYQLLPYFPQIDKFFRVWEMPDREEYHLSISSDSETFLTEGQDFEYIKDSNDNIVGVVVFPQISNFSFSIQRQLSLKRSMKIDSQCDFYRLCSPNYSGLFQFDVTRNGGVVNGFDVDCSYKPYNPYIRVAPQFSWLYGTNFHDGRGLICGGDFSLPIISNEWTNYQIQNKNFANIFARDIQNLDFNQKQEALYESVGAVTGTVGGAGGGAFAGAKLGGGYGALAGAAIGGGVGAIGGAMDISLGASRRREQRSYAVDKYKLQLANVKAIPDSLTRNSSITISNKVFPFLEYYSCTDIEKDALEQKIKYEGMTVMRIGQISEFLDLSQEFNYIKGEFIHLDDLSEDSHMADAIYDELSKGVYYYA